MWGRQLLGFLSLLGGSQGVMVGCKKASAMNQTRYWLISLLLIMCCLPVVAFSQGHTVAPLQNPLAGSRVFGAKGCSMCHAVNGVGGRVGPDLGRIQVNRSFDDLAAALWNHLPQMGAQMKTHQMPPPHLTSDEVGDLIAFLFTQNYFASSGNAEAGKQLFTAKRCIMCHQMGGVGGVIASSLDAVGQSASPMDVTAAMWNHGPDMMKAMRARGIERPRLSVSELRDLIAYLRAMAPGRTVSPLRILPGRMDNGRELFTEKHCIDCHTIQGTGGDIGPELGRRGMFRDLTEFAVALWNKAPDMIRAMQLRNVAVPALTGEEMADIVAYLRSMQYFDASGRADHGRQLLEEKQCLRCHAFDDKGGKAARDLARVKGLDSAPAVIAALWRHIDVMIKASPHQPIAWPRLKPDDMADMMAFFEQLSRSAR